MNKGQWNFPRKSGKLGRALESKLPEPRRSYGWHCELVHDKSGEVVNENFFRDAPIEGSCRLKGYTWRATALYAQAVPLHSVDDQTHE